MSLSLMQLTDKDDDLGAQAHDLKRSADAKTREIKDSWTR
jgi:hypothetical protein